MPPDSHPVRPRSDQGRHRHAQEDQVRAHERGGALLAAGRSFFQEAVGDQGAGAPGHC